MSAFFGKGTRVVVPSFRTVLVPNAHAGELVARNEVEIGVAQAPEIAAVPGTQVDGPLRGDLGSSMVFSAGIGATSQIVPPPNH